MGTGKELDLWSLGSEHGGRQRRNKYNRGRTRIGAGCKRLRGTLFTPVELFSQLWFSQTSLIQLDLVDEFELFPFSWILLVKQQQQWTSWQISKNGGSSHLRKWCLFVMLFHFLWGFLNLSSSSLFITLFSVPKVLDRGNIPHAGLCEVYPVIPRPSQVHVNILSSFLSFIHSFIQNSLNQEHNIFGFFPLIVRNVHRCVPVCQVCQNLIRYDFFHTLTNLHLNSSNRILCH